MIERFRFLENIVRTTPSIIQRLINPGIEATNNKRLITTLKRKERTDSAMALEQKTN